MIHSLYIPIILYIIIIHNLSNKNDTNSELYKMLLNFRLPSLTIKLGEKKIKVIIHLSNVYIRCLPKYRHLPLVLSNLLVFYDTTLYFELKFFSRKKNKIHTCLQLLTPIKMNIIMFYSIKFVDNDKINVSLPS